MFQIFEGDILHTPHTTVSDPNRPYVLFTDASKYGWAGVLTQTCEEIDESTKPTAKVGTSQRKTVVHHPVSYISGLFRGSQLNWAALTSPHQH